MKTKSKSDPTIVEIVARDRWSGPEFLEKRIFKTREKALAWAEKYNRKSCPPVAQVPDYYVAAYVKD